MNTLQRGLYLTLFGAATLGACNRIGEAVDTQTPIASTNTLEQIADSPVKEPTSAPIERTFTNPEKEYSLLSPPSHYGYSLNDRLTEESINFFMDVYSSEEGAINISGFTLDMSLKEAYLNHSLYTAKTLGDNLSMTFAPGEGFEIKGEGPERKISIDDMPALRGGAQFWMYGAGKDPMSREKDDYTHMITMHCAAAQDQGNIYLFSIIYEQIDAATDAKSEQFFEDVMNGFTPLK